MQSRCEENACVKIVHACKLKCCRATEQAACLSDCASSSFAVFARLLLWPGILQLLQHSGSVRPAAFLSPAPAMQGVQLMRGSSDVSANDVVNGSREATLGLLWRAFLKFQVYTYSCLQRQHVTFRLCCCLFNQNTASTQRCTGRYVTTCKV